MAESIFLKWQDKNGDMLPDACPDDAIPRANTCLPCSPNPNAIVPDWKTRNQSQPFLNEKLCVYQISYLTKEKHFGYYDDITKREAAEKLDAIWQHYADEWDNNVGGSLNSDWLQTVSHRKGEPRKGAIRALLNWKGKDTSPESIQKIKSAMEKSEYYLAPNPGSYVQLLYSVEYSVLEDLPDAPPVDTSEEAEQGDTTAKYATGDLVLSQITVRKGLHLWSRYLRVFRMLESSNLIFSKTGKIFNLDDYGDAGPFDMHGQLSVLQLELDSWLNDQGMNIPNTGTWGFFNQNVEHIEFTVTGEYKLKKIRVWTDRCNELPVEFGKDRLDSLSTQPGWRDPTAVAYFMKMEEIASELSARTEQPWLDMALKYTYPKIHVVGPGAGQIMPEEGAQGVTTCIANALADEAKQFGQDILDDMFSIGDGIAYEFHSRLCQHEKEKVKEDEDEQGQAEGAAPPGEGPTGPGGGQQAGPKKPAPPKKPQEKKSDKKNTMVGAAIMKAHKKIDPRDQVFAHFCLRMLSTRDNATIGEAMDDIWRFNFERIKVCGLFDLLMSAIECLTKGISLEDALSIMLKNALSSMTYENFGKLFVGLPPEKQAKLDAMVRKNLEEGKTLEGFVNPYTDVQDPELEGPDTGEASGVEYSPGAAAGTAGGVGQSTTQREGVYAGAKSESMRGERFFGRFSIARPWEDQELVERQRTYNNGLGNEVPVPPGQPSTMEMQQESRGGAETRRTLAQKLDPAKAAKENLDSSKIFQAYILALLEEYSDNYLALLDKLNDFPGAQIIAFFITSIDCPRPPLFNPGINDFIKSITLPFCRNNAEIVIPRLDWPTWWWPLLLDPWKAVFDYLKKKLNELIFKYLILLIVKVCELVGKAICKALEITGQIAASLPSLIAGTNTLTNIIRDSICGPDTPTQEVENTVVQLIADLGVGGQALANPDRALTFAEDLSSAATQAEMTSAVLGNPSETFLQIADQIVENGFPEYRDALPNQRAIGSFFKNIGFLAPVQMRDEMAIALETLGAQADEMPANPTLCATPDQLDAFKDLRCTLLEGRATPEQCDQMFDNWRGTMLEDLDDVTSLMQRGIGPTLMDQMPPMISDPGCNNGLMPYEPEDIAATAATMVEGEMKKMQQAYARDMLGSGGFLSFLAGGVDSSWGFLNMILSDTVGNPFTRHQVDVASDSNYVDFYLNTDTSLDSTNKDDIEDAMGSNVASLRSQRGAYPQYVAEWLMYQYKSAAQQPIDDRLLLGDISQDLRDSMEFSSTNIPRRTKKWPVSFASLGFDSLFTTSDVELTDVPDMGYNVKTAPDWSEENLWFIKLPRKDDPDIALEFKDNAKGHRLGLNGGKSAWSYKFRVNAYISDMMEGPVKGSYVNRPDDNTRIYLTEFFNEAARPNRPPFDAYHQPNPKEAKGMSVSFDSALEVKEIRSRKYEFMAVDNGLDSLYDPDPDKGEYLSMEHFPNLSQSFVKQTPFAPQINMLYDLFGTTLSKSQIKEKYDSFMKEQFVKVAKEIGNNTKAWEYGMTFDDLDITDFDYLDSKTGDLYSEKTVKDYDSEGERILPDRPVSEDDGIMGVSRNQYVNEQAGTHPEKTRVFFLNPTQYGGSYMQPPIYVKPRKSVGWAGLVEVMFPELSPCDPSQTDAVDFNEISAKINEIYPNIPEDDRLRGDPDCVVEVPYNRILHRLSKATIEGIIIAAIRVYASVHFMKGLPIFTKFAPKFPDNYSNIYSSYIIETMEQDFRDSTSLWSPFSDNEFWYAFLEQAVQTYGRRVDSGDINEEDVPKHVSDALDRLNNYQQSYDYPFIDELVAAKYGGEAGIFETLKSYRESRNLEAVYRTQEDAKLVLKELVNEQLEFMGDKFIKNIESFDMSPDVYDLDYYYMTEFTALGSNELNLDGTIVESVVGLPTEEEPDPAGLGWEWPGPFYTDGNEFSLSDGSIYAGYYHASIDEQDGSLTYTVGEYHSDEAQELLRPFANKVIIGVEKVIDTGSPDEETGKKIYETTFDPLGDIPDGERASTTTARPFYMYKYIKVNSTRKNMADGVTDVKARGSGVISQHFPGTMQLSINDEGVEVGITGELGVRYGLSFGMVFAGTEKEIVNIEIDALDIPVSAFTGIEPNSKILYCLLAKLKEDHINNGHLSRHGLYAIYRRSNSGRRRHVRIHVPQD